MQKHTFQSKQMSQVTHHTYTHIHMRSVQRAGFGAAAGQSSSTQMQKGPTGVGGVVSASEVLYRGSRGSRGSGRRALSALRGRSGGRSSLALRRLLGALRLILASCVLLTAALPKLGVLSGRGVLGLLRLSRSRFLGRFLGSSLRRRLRRRCLGARRGTICPSFHLHQPVQPAPPVCTPLPSGCVSVEHGREQNGTALRTLLSSQGGDETLGEFRLEPLRVEAQGLQLFLEVRHLPN